MKFFLRFLFFFAISFSIQGRAKTLVISDIDDTLKVSHVRNFFDALRYMNKTHARFKGMREALYLLSHLDSEVEFFYLSNAPEMFMERYHRNFLEEGQFPQGLLVLRNHLSRKDHKLYFLRKWIRKQRPRKVILLGDNGEKDPFVYYQISQEFPEVSFYVYIHILYPSVHRLYPNEVGFVTPVEVLWDLKSKGLIQGKALKPFLDHFLWEAIQETDPEPYSPLFFPKWIECQDFKWIWKGPSLELQALENKLDLICHSHLRFGEER
ncbi:MAG: DUF2183 domain-containing protein [Bdellovibrio sp.]|nr:MAG: DUF2183 domain-containing protein [Bdellovibrio sp.]